MTAEKSPDRARRAQSVTYGSVGGTQAVDLMTYPPRGHSPLEVRGRVGHGDERWSHAVEELLTGGVYRGAGMAVRVEPAAGEQDAAHYVPVGFDELGDPVAPAELAVAEETYSPSGHRYLRPGDTVTVGPALGGRMLWPLPGRVVLLEQSPTRVLYAVGTLPGHPFSGEESFLLEREPDGSIWLTVRSFARPAHAGWMLASPVLWPARRIIAGRFLRALSAPIPGSSPLPSQRLEAVSSAPEPVDETIEARADDALAPPADDAQDR